jgi:hypothetical protein
LVLWGDGGVFGGVGWGVVRVVLVVGWWWWVGGRVVVVVVIEN